jgi:hypothetical protein
MGKARMLSESLATLQSILGVDLRNLTQAIAGNLAGNGRPDGQPASQSAPTATA